MGLGKSNGKGSKVKCFALLKWDDIIFWDFGDKKVIILLVF